jgi:hypothetical protein
LSDSPSEEFIAKSRLRVHQKQENFANVPAHNQIVPAHAWKPNIVLCPAQGSGGV